MENTHADSVGFAVLDRDDGLQTNRGVSGSNRVAFHVPDIRHGGGGQAYSACGQVRQGGVRPQERAPNYPIALVWGGILLCVAVGALFTGMAIHDARAAQQVQHPTAIYYCSTGVEMPMFEPCKEMKDQRNV
jgi:hypothetical protein